MATWYYVENGEQRGPLQEDAFRQLIAAGTITGETLVWNETMSAWQAYGSLREAAVRDQVAALAGERNDDATEPTTFRATAAGTAAVPRACAECGREVNADELIPIGGRWICAHCKPLALQMVREGVGAIGMVRYAGFWIRFGAKLIDGLIMFLVNIAVQAVVSALFMPIGRAAGIEGLQIVSFILSTLAQMGVGIAYSVFFLGRFGATPGKMACGIQVRRSDGSAISYLRALGRSFADILSGVPTLFIGYIIAAFDAEKRALHDHICDTRVIYK